MAPSSFKCNSCAIQFPNSDSQRFHMKTDWHRYNLKRRVAELPPVDGATFIEKLQISKQYEEETDEFGFKLLKSKESKKPYIRHNHHGHNFSSRSRPLDVEKGSSNRNLSPASTIATGMSQFSLGDPVYSHPPSHSDIDSNFGSHFETDFEATTASEEEGSNTEEEQSDGDEEIYIADEVKDHSIQPITSCIYCGLPHSELETNVTHMFKAHGLYIPERSYLADLEGLLGHLISIIVLENECLCCNFKGKNLESIRAHVTSKGHCRLPYETKEERAKLEEFYDFSSINSTVEKSKSLKKVGFIEDSEASQNGISDDETHLSNYTLATIDPIDRQLFLPNGTRLGHRSLNRIYRQNISISNEPSEAQLTVSAADRRLTNALTLQQQKGQKAMQIAEYKARSKQFEREIKRANFQPHFRDQMLGG